VAAAAILISLPDGPARTRETLKTMRLLTIDGKCQPIVRDTACRIAQRCASQDFLCEIECVFRWVRDNIRYIRDVNDVETVHFADQIMAQRWGDCDDASVLLASMLESIGCSTRFVSVAFAGDDYSHVLAEVDVTAYDVPAAVPTRSDVDGSVWLSLDATTREKFGWFPPGVTAEMRIKNRECA
jgi:hypothetical protein